MGLGPNPNPNPSSYVPSFPFYDAEPYWPKRNSGSGSGGSGGSANIGETLPYCYHVSMTDIAAFYLSTSPFTDVSGKTFDQLDNMSISSVTASGTNGNPNSIDVYVSDGLYFCCVLITEESMTHCKGRSSSYIQDYEWGDYAINNDRFVYVTGPTNISSDHNNMEFVMITDVDDLS